ncbi:MAG: hypothetical protein EBT86_00755 [Actinobacteria bacterium]|nr:hypothetical protein [Actinomycetota bacterium]
MSLTRDSVIDILPACVLRPDVSRGLNHLHVAILVRRGKILATATNREGNRSCGCGFSDWSLHAERAVIKKVGDINKLRGAIMIVIRLVQIKKKSAPSLAKSDPCYDCQKFLKKCMKEYGLRAVYYS